MRRGDPDGISRVRDRVARIISSGRIDVPVDEREDLVQEVLAELWQAVNRKGFDFAAGFWGFVEVVTARRCIDWLRLRRQRGLVPDDLVDCDGTQLDGVLAAERSEIVAEVLEELNPECRQVILMRMKGGLSYRAMSRELGRSEGALRVQVYRCIHVARRILRERYPHVIGRTDRSGSDEPQSG